MTCDTFRSLCRAGDDSLEMLTHLRGCASCAEFAVEIDPEFLFRSIGGTDIVPPGGVELFVDEVMQQIHVRDAETAIIGRPRIASTWRWAAAAAVIIGLFSLVAVNRPLSIQPSPVVRTAALKPAAPSSVQLLSRPVVESYDSPNATIVEVPNENNQSDVKIVMVFDESLPADL